MKTSELTGAALDWAVAMAEGNVRLQYDSQEGLIINNVLGWIPYRPSLAWQQGGPIIEREFMCISRTNKTREQPWAAYIDGYYSIDGPTLLIAAMRCYVASKLGYEVDVPEELK